MTSNHKQFIIIIVILLISAALVGIMQYKPYEESDLAVQRIGHIPKKLGNWSGTDAFLEEAVFEILETRAIIHREYKTGDASVFLSLVYYPETKVDFHAPEACLAGRGVTVSKTTTSIKISNDGNDYTIGVNKLIRRNESYEELIYYMYKTGDFLGKSYIKLRFALLFNKFFDRGKSGSLIRISTPVPDGDMQSASQRLEGFMDKLYPYLRKYL